MMLRASEQMLRLVMAELVRQQLDLGGQAKLAETLVKATGYRERDVDRYPGTSSWWVDSYVDIGWVDDAGESHTYEFKGTWDQLITALERTVEEY